MGMEGGSTLGQVTTSFQGSVQAFGGLDFLSSISRALTRLLLLNIIQLEITFTPTKTSNSQIKMNRLLIQNN